MSDEEMFDLWRSRGVDAKSIKIAKRIYDEVLDPICGAYHAKGREDNSLRQGFVYWFATSDGEFRFQGRFGFGGKFWNTNYGGWYVNYYREDRNDARDKAEKKANEALKTLRAELDT